MPSLGIEMRRNGFIVEAVGSQSSSLLNQLLMVMELFEVPNRSDHSVLGAGSPCPVALQVDVLAVFKDRYGNLLQHQPRDGLPVVHGCRRRPPDSWNICCQPPDGGLFFRLQASWLLCGEARMLCLKLLLSGKSRLPGPLQGPGDQPVLRFGRFVTPLGKLDFIAGALETLIPLPILLPALQLDVLGQLQADVNRRRRQRFQNESADEVIDGPGLKR